MIALSCSPPDCSVVRKDKIPTDDLFQFMFTFFLKLSKLIFSPAGNTCGYTAVVLFFHNTHENPISVGEKNLKLCI